MKKLFWFLKDVTSSHLDENEEDPCHNLKFSSSDIWGDINVTVLSERQAGDGGWVCGGVTFQHLIKLAWTMWSLLYHCSSLSLSSLGIQARREETVWCVRKAATTLMSGVTMHYRQAAAKKSTFNTDAQISVNNSHRLSLRGPAVWNCTKLHETAWNCSTW